MTSTHGPSSVAELETLLSTPDGNVLETLARTPGDVIVLGAGGKMGPTLARMLRRAADERGDTRRIIAVSRFGNAAIEQALAATGVEIIRSDLTDVQAVARLPRSPNVIFMAGQKFGTRDDPAATWAMNASVPTLVAQHFGASRTVVFSTGNVYPLTPVSHGGSRESDDVAPIGEYANSCVARERIFTYYAAQHGTPLSILRLNYAVELRYGVLVDIAARVFGNEPVPLTMGYANVIWQGDANALAIAALAHASTPPFIVNVTGPETIAVRDIALRFGDMTGRVPVFAGTEAPDALLSNTARMRDTLGAPGVGVETMMRWIADWMIGGGEVLGRPTHFETRDGDY